MTLEDIKGDIAVRRVRERSLCHFYNARSFLDTGKDMGKHFESVASVWKRLHRTSVPNSD